MDIPDYTPEQLSRDTLRGYNGYADGKLVRVLTEPGIEGEALAVAQADDWGGYLPGLVYAGQ